VAVWAAALFAQQASWLEFFQQAEGRWLDVLRRHVPQEKFRLLGRD
jgi:hypothetical protein